MAASSNQLISFYFSSLNLHHLLEHNILIDGLLQALWLDCSSLLSAMYVLLGAALHVCQAGFKLNLHSSYYPRNEMKTKYIKTIAKVNSKFL